MRVFTSALSFTTFVVTIGGLAIGGGLASAAPDPVDLAIPVSLTNASAGEIQADPQLADFEVAAREPDLAGDERVLYSVLSDQIREMRRKSALPTVMCLAENNGDGTAQTLPQDVMARLVADNAEADDGLFTLKPATACISAGDRIVDSETHSRALLITAGPMEDEMKGLMSGCGDFVGGFVRAEGDSDYDFYAVNGGDVARQIGCELVQ
jgi:hypothetical protein